MSVAFLRCVFLSLAGALFLPSTRAGADEPPLSKQAEEALARGKAAFAAEDWPLAVKYYSEAQRSAPYAGAVLFNLGIAHARAGHELAGAAWLHAYLAASKPADAAARPCQVCGNRLNQDGGCPDCVKGEIIRLEVATDSKASKIFRQAIDLAKKRPDHAESQTAFGEIIAAQDEAGDTEGALATLRLLDEKQESYSSWRDNLGEKRAAELMRGGDRRGADEALRGVTFDSRGSAGSVLVDSLLERGDVMGAFAGEILGYLNHERRDYAVEYFVGREIREGKFTLIEKVIPRLGVEHQLNLLEAAFEKKMELEDLPGAKEAAKRGLGIAGAMSQVAPRTAGLARFAFFALRAGDEESARAAAEKVLASGEPTEAYDGPRASIPGAPSRELGICFRSSAVAAAILGKHEEARAFLKRYEYPSGAPRWGAYTPPACVALLQCLSGKPDEARVTVKENIGREKGDMAWLSSSAVAIVRFYLSRGKPAEALAAIEDQSRQSAFSFVYTGHYQELNVLITRELAKAGDIDGARKAFRSVETCSYAAERALVAPNLFLAAQALADHKESADALRVLKMAAKVAGEEPLCDTLAKIAALQTSLGDPEAAASTRTLIRDPRLKKWVERALELSGLEVVVDLPTALTQAPTRPRDGSSEPCRATDIPGQIARVASRLKMKLEQERWLAR